jgi:hypothetical protein
MIVNCGFEMKINNKTYKYKNKQGIHIPDNCCGQELRDELKKHAPGPEWSLIGYAIMKDDGGHK